MVVISDVSAKMKQTKDDLADKMKMILLSSISHELITPLQQVLGMLSIVKD